MGSGPPVSGTGVPVIADMNMTPGGGGMAGDMYSSKTMPQPSTLAPQLGGIGAGNTMMIDDAMMYPGGYDSLGGLYGNPAAMQEPEMPAMDWDYLVHVTSFGGFNANGNFYAQGAGG